MSDATLRKSLIKLAKAHPELRGDLLPLLKTARDESLENTIERLRKLAQELEAGLEIAYLIAAGLRGPSLRSGMPDENPPLAKILQRARQGANEASYSIHMSERHLRPQDRVTPD